MFNIWQLDTRWCLPGRLDDNPMVWMIQVNGYVVDARHAPREIQEAALRHGLIPYIPGDAQGTHKEKPTGYRHSYPDPRASATMLPPARTGCEESFDRLATQEAGPRFRGGSRICSPYAPMSETAQA